MGLNRQGAFEKKIAHPLMKAILEKDPEKKQALLLMLPEMLRQGQLDFQDEADEETAERGIRETSRGSKLLKAIEANRKARAQATPQPPGAAQLDAERPERTMAANADAGMRQNQQTVMAGGAPDTSSSGNVLADALTGTPGLEGQLQRGNLAPGQTVEGTVTDSSIPLNAGVSFGPFSARGSIAPDSLMGKALGFFGIKGSQTSSIRLPSARETAGNGAAMWSQGMKDDFSKWEAGIRERYAPQHADSMVAMAKAFGEQQKLSDLTAKAGLLDNFVGHIKGLNPEVFGDPKRIQGIMDEFERYYDIGDPEILINIYKGIGISSGAELDKIRNQVVTERIRQRQELDRRGISSTNPGSMEFPSVLAPRLDLQTGETVRQTSSGANYEGHLAGLYKQRSNLVERLTDAERGMMGTAGKAPFAVLPAALTGEWDSVLRLTYAEDLISRYPYRAGFAEAKAGGGEKQAAPGFRTTSLQEVAQTTAGFHNAAVLNTATWNGVTDVIQHLGPKGGSSVPTAELLDNLNEKLTTKQGRAEIRQFLSSKHVQADQLDNAMAILDEMLVQAKNGYYFVWDANEQRMHMLVDEYSNWDHSPVGYVGRGNFTVGRAMAETDVPFYVYGENGLLSAQRQNGNNIEGSFVQIGNRMVGISDFVTGRPPRTELWPSESELSTFEQPAEIPEPGAPVPGGNKLVSTTPEGRQKAQRQAIAADAKAREWWKAVVEGPETPPELEGLPLRELRRRQGSTPFIDALRERRRQQTSQ